MVRNFAALAPLWLPWLGGGCVFVPPPPLPGEVDQQRARQDARIAELRAGQAGPPGGADAAKAAPSAGREQEAGARPGMSEAERREYATAQGDPEGGAFSLEQATVGLMGTGPLWARLETSRGNIECELLESVAPGTVANFVGLARGRRPFKDAASGEWNMRPYYDGTVFHRVIPGFMIQGGDQLGTGLGNAGYVIAEELDPTVQHESAGRLSMANRGPVTGSSQFFITLGPTPHLDGKHTIFGRCDEAGIAVADDISLTPRGPDDRPHEDEVLQRVVIYRKGGSEVAPDDAGLDEPAASEPDN